MSVFCGQEACRIDRNGRVRLTPRLLDDFKGTSLDVMLHCLPEGALAVYPETTWKQMRSHEPRPAERAGNSIVYRREQRRFGAFSQPQTITNQGRITIPQLFREIVDLPPGVAAILVGTEIGIEIWNEERWTQEARKMMSHESQRAEAEMNHDLVDFTMNGMHNKRGDGE